MVAESTVAPRAPVAFLLLWSAIVLSIPFYIFPSGTAQPADLAMACVFAIALVTGFGYLSVDSRSAVVRLLAYTLVVGCVNLAWATIWSWSSFDFLRSTLFAVFNWLVFAGFLVLADRYGVAVVRWTAWATGLSLIAQAGLSVVFSSRADGHRLVLFFNNPNQLAFYALGAASIVLLVASVERVPRWLIVSTCAAAAWLLFRSYSRAAGIGFIVLIVLFVVRRPATVLLGLGPAAFLGFVMDSAFADDELWQMRMAAVRQGDVGDYVEDRGLERIFEFPEYAVLGAGEGMHMRFHPLGLELHSSLANVVFSYGIAGVVTLGAFGYAVYRRLPIRSVALIIPTVLYSLFHNGTRFRTFWLVLAVATALGSIVTQRRRHTMTPDSASERTPDASDDPIQIAVAQRRAAR